MSESILKKAKDLRELVKRHSEIQKLANDLEGFKTRRNELLKFANILAGLLQTQKILLQGGVPVQIDKTSLRAFRERISSIAEVFINNPKSILQPKALELDQSQSILYTVSNSLIQIWKSYVAPKTQVEALVNVLERYPTFRETARRLRTMQQQLVEKGEKLPYSEQDVTAVKNLNGQLVAEIQSLSGKGLDEEVLDFLRRSATGVSLREFLKKPKVLKWIQQEELTESFQIKCT